MKNRTFGQWLCLIIVLLLIAGLGTVASFTLFTLANYGEVSEKLTSSLKTKDTNSTKDELLKLHYYYDLSKKWKVQAYADEYLFKDAPFYQHGDDYNIGHWQKVIDDLKDKQDDPRAYLYGDARFRWAQGQYQVGHIKEALEFILKDVAEDFEKALRVCLESGSAYLQCFDRIYNYDLVTNKKDAEEALKNPQQGPVPKFMLGPKKDKNGKPIPVPGKKDKKGDGLEGDQEGGSGSPRKRP